MESAKLPSGTSFSVHIPFTSEQKRQVKDYLKRHGLKAGAWFGLLAIKAIGNEASKERTA